MTTGDFTEFFLQFGCCGPEQCGSLFQKGCADATFSLKLAHETLKEHNQKACASFVDLVKAHDTVNRESLWRTLKHFGAPDKEAIKALKKPHENVTCEMKVGTKKETVTGEAGVKQGDNLGPILFIHAIQAVSTSMDKKWSFQNLISDGMEWKATEHQNATQT